MGEGKSDESFAALFEQTKGAVPSRSGPRVGDVVQVVVVQVGKDAVFVELDGRRQGFIETVNLKSPDGETKAAVGDKMQARVSRVDAQGIALVPTVETAAAVGAAVSLGAEGEPEGPKVAVGQVITGVVDRVESYGIFLQIEGTKGRAGRGLAPVSELGTPRGADLRKHFPMGTKLKAKVIGLEEGKMRLSLRALKDDEERADFEGFRSKEKQTSAPQGFGTLGDLLKKKK
jgi:small subunit ribosomal protein S1